MVKTGKRDGEPLVYEVASQFLQHGFSSDDSVFSPGTRVWTKESFDELGRDFVEGTDQSEKTFEAKLRGQLATSSDAAKQLMAELLYLHLLVSSKIGAKKKQAIVENVLEWMDQPVSIPSEILPALELGFINPGAYYNTGRWAQIRFLIETGRRWKTLSESEQVERLADPWRFKALLEEVPEGGAASQRHALLHLLFPSEFEAIVSDKHLARIIARFASLTSGQSLDPERQMQEIRLGLTPRYGETFDFYDPRLRPLWEQDIDPWPELIQWAGRLHASPRFDETERSYKIEAVRLGPDLVEALAQDGGWLGTLVDFIGDDRNNLTDWRTNDDFIGWAESQPEQAYRCLIGLLRGPESMSDRVQTFCNQISEAVSTPGNRVAIASYLLMGMDPLNVPFYKPTPFLKIQQLLGRTASKGNEKERYDEAVSFCDELIAEASSGGLILRDRLDAQSVIWLLTTAKEDSLFLQEWSEEDRQAFLSWREGAAGSPKPDHADEEESVIRPADTPTVPLVDWMQWAARETYLPREYLVELTELLQDKGQIVLYGPPGTGKTFVAQVLAKAVCSGEAGNFGLVQFHPATTYEDFFEGIRPRTDGEGRIHYEIRPGPLARFAAMALDRPSEQFVLVIDELNRANLPKVLGELLFLLEYRDQEAFTLYRSEKPFKLPSNLQFIATMNTVDRSVAIIDAAMRRRFHFVPFYPDQSPVADVLSLICSPEESWVADLVDQVNMELIEELGGRDYQLGASHFINSDRTLDGLERIWRYTIEPLIEDQFFGSEDRVQKFRWKQVLARHLGQADSDDVSGEIGEAAKEQILLRE